MKIVALFVKLIYREIAVPLPSENLIKNKYEIKKYHHSRYGIARIYGMQRHKATANGIINI